MEQVHLKISGSVQGVFFRAETKEKALELGLTGFVKNTQGGGVEVFAQGPREKLEALIEWCRKGPDAANVSHIEITWGNPQEKLETFEIRYG